MKRVKVKSLLDKFAKFIKAYDDWANCPQDRILIDRDKLFYLMVKAREEMRTDLRDDQKNGIDNED